MNTLEPISKIMTKNLLTVGPEDKLADIKKIFDENNINHIPVVDFKKVVGIISKQDYLYFLRGSSKSVEDRFFNEARLRAYRARDIMTSKIAKVEETDRLNVAIEVFRLNRFHALPVVNAQEELVGIITTHDIIRRLVESTEEASS
jgi:acetoin utilization protein AcuB